MSDALNRSVPQVVASPPVQRTVLAVRLCNWIGDVIMCLPALQLLASRGYDVHLYGKGWVRDLLSAYDWPVTVRQGKLADRKSQIRAMGARQALIFPNSFSSALEMRLAGLETTGYAKDGRSLFLSHRFPLPGKQRHALESFWDLTCKFLGEALPPPTDIGMEVTPTAQAHAAQLITVHGLQKFVCIAPFATGQMYQYGKKWPEFSAFVKLLVSQGVQVVVCPGPGEEEEAEQFYPGAVCLKGVPLSTYCALLKQASLMVANDTGPGHMAAAMGTPLISVLGPTPPAHWRPWGSQVEVICQWPKWPTSHAVLDRALFRLSASETVT
jgi:heptosyltransferase II